jgi:hypothetical protein
MDVRGRESVVCGYESGVRGAACRVKDEARANREFEKLAVPAQIVVERICRENGVTMRR